MCVTMTVQNRIEQENEETSDFPVCHLLKGQIKMKKSEVSSDYLPEPQPRQRPLFLLIGIPEKREQMIIANFEANKIKS